MGLRNWGLAHWWHRLRGIGRVWGHPAKRTGHPVTPNPASPNPAGHRAWIGLDPLLAAVAATPDALRPWAELAEAHNDQGRPDEARAAYRKALHLANADTGGWFAHSGSLLNRSGGRGIAACRAMACLRPDDPDGWMAFGMALEDGDRHEEALGVYRTLARLAPERAASWAALGHTQTQLGRHDDSLAARRTAAALIPDAPSTWIGIGETLVAIGRRADALRAQYRALCLTPHDRWSWVRVVNTLRDLGTREDPDLRRVIIAVAPDEPDGWAALGRSLQQLNRHDAAAQAFRRAVALDRGTPRLWPALTAALRLAGRDEDALGALRDTLALHPGDRDVGHEFASALARLNRDEEAERVHRRVLRLFPDGYASWHGLVALFRKHRKADAAERAARRLVALRPADHDGWRVLGEIRDNAGRRQEMVRVQRRLLRLEPLRGPVPWAVAASHLDQVLDHAGAARAYRNALAFAPAELAHWSRLSLMLALLGERDERRRSDHRALRLVSGSDGLDTWSWHGCDLVGHELPDDAGHVFRTALCIDPAYSFAWLELSSLHEQQGRQADALRASLISVRLTPNDDNLWIMVEEAAKRLGSPEMVAAVRRILVLLNPEYADAWLRLADSLHPLERWAEVARIRLCVVRLRPKDQWAWSRLQQDRARLGLPAGETDPRRIRVFLTPDDPDAWLDLGVELRNLNRLEAAAQACRRAARLRANDPDAWAHLSDILARQGLLGQAIELRRLIVAARPDDYPALYSLGSMLPGIHRTAEAERVLRHSLRLRSWDRNALLQLAQIFKTQGEAAKEERLRRNLIAVSPAVSYFWADLGSILRVQGARSRATDAYRRALRIDPESTAYQSHLNDLLPQHERSVPAPPAPPPPSPRPPPTPDAVVPWEHHVRTLCNARGFDEARRCLRIALALDPAHPPFWRHLGQSLEQGYGYEPAATALACRRAIRLGAVSTPWDWIEIANSFFRCRDQAGAEDSFRRAITLHPSSHELYREFGHALSNWKRHADGRTLYHRYLHLAPPMQVPWTFVAIILRDCQDSAGQARAHRIAIAINPGDENAWSTLGGEQAGQGRFVEAERSYRRAIRINHESHSWHSLCGVLDRQGRQAESLRVQRHIVALLPTEATRWIVLGNRLNRLGQHAEAARVFGLLLRLDRNSRDGWNNLANAYVGMGRHARAEHTYNRCVALFPDDALPVGNIGHIYNNLGHRGDAGIRPPSGLRLLPHSPLIVEAPDGEVFDPLIEPSLPPSLWPVQGDTPKAAALGTAVRLYHRCIRVSPGYVPAWSGLGNVCQEQGNHAAAAHAYRRSLALRPDEPVWRALGNSLNALGLSDEARSAFRHALRLSPTDGSSWEGLGVALHGQGELDGALDAFGRAYSFASHLPPSPRYRLCIEDALRSPGSAPTLERFLPLLEVLAESGFLDDMVRLLERERAALDADPVRNGGDGDGRAVAWRRASDLGTARERLIALAAVTDGNERLLRPLQGVGAIAAALAIADQRPDDGVVALERSLAAGIGHTLNLRRQSIAQLRATGKSHLAARFETAVEALRAAEKAGDGIDARHALHREVQRVIKDIQAVDPHFLAEPRLDAILKTAQDRPLVYLFSAPAAGGAFVVTGSGTTAIPLPELARDPAARRIRSFLNAQALLDHGRHQDFLPVLEETTRWLWDSAMGPLSQCLDTLNAKAAVLIPAGALTTLPFHAAWREVDGRRRHAIEDRVYSVAPSARFLRSTAPDAPPSDVLAVVNPTGDLPVIAAGFAAIRSRLDAAGWRVRALVGGAGTDEGSIDEGAILDAVQRAGVLYWAGHGDGDLDRPRRGVLRLADGRAIALGELIDRGGLALDLAFLAACQTGRSGQILPDEAVSFASGLMAAGARAVLAPLWSVPEEATARLAGDFFAIPPGHTPAEALRLAQLAMLNGTDIPATAARTLRASVGSVTQGTMADAGLPSCAPLICWAAFQCVGG